MRRQLFTKDGNRKYLTDEEVKRFLAAANSHERGEVRTLCLVLAFTGCRISEALALDAINLVHHIRKAQKSSDEGKNMTLWSWGRTQATKHICDVMKQAGITGSHASPKGLRHGFGVNAATKTRNPRLVQKWLGHRSLETTIIYMDAVGDEERELASRMWE